MIDKFDWIGYSWVPNITERWIAKINKHDGSNKGVTDGIFLPKKALCT